MTAAIAPAAPGPGGGARPRRPEAYARAFALGFLLFGGFDLLYTRAGGQRYGPAAEGLPSVGGWPLHVPLQMGLAAVTILFLWSLAMAVTGPSSRRAGSGVAPPVALLLLVLGLGMAFPLLGSPWHDAVFLWSCAASFLGLAARRERRSLAAFCSVGVAGPLVEWVLIGSEGSYWSFARDDLLGRLPAWEPYVYGWIGVTIAAISDRYGTAER